MRNAILSFLGLCIVGCNQNENEISLELIPVKQGEYWGYINKEGNYLINPQFNVALTFKEGLAIIWSSEGKYGFINTDGKIVIPAVYKDASYFSDGLAPVVKENQNIEYIDKTGKTIISLDASIEAAEPFAEGLALVKVGNKWNYIDKTGKITFDTPFEFAKSFSNGYALFHQKVGNEFKSGYIDKTGKVVITPQFSFSSSFYENMAMVRINDKLGFINKSGKIVISPQFDNCYNFSNGLAAVKQGELWGFINKEGKFEINPQFKYVGSFNKDGLCPVSLTSIDKWGFITKDGKFIIDPQFEEVWNFYDDIALVKLDNKWGAINKKGKYLINPIFDDATIKYRPSVFPVQSDYFDISSISSLLYKDINANSVRGMNKGITFKQLQSLFKNLNHDNYERYLEFEKESNISIELSSINFFFYPDFYSSSIKFKKEERFDIKRGVYYEDVFDGITKTFNDETPLSFVRFNFNLLKNAKLKATEIIRELKKIFPHYFNIEDIDDSSFILNGTDYGIGINYLEDENILSLIIAFDKSALSPMKNSLSNSVGQLDNNVIAVDTAAK